MSAIYRPTLDEVGKYGELRPNFMFWLAVAAVSRHVWFTAAVIAASARVKEASALLAGFSWWPVLIEAPRRPRATGLDRLAVAGNRPLQRMAHGAGPGICGGRDARPGLAVALAVCPGLVC